MKIELNLNPDEALALIQVLERDHVFPDVTGPIIQVLDQARLDWAHDVRNIAHARELVVNPEDIDAWHRWEEKHKVSLRLETVSKHEPEDMLLEADTDDGSTIWFLDGADNLLDITEQVKGVRK